MKSKLWKKELCGILWLLALAVGQADRVSLIKCAEFAACVENVNQETLMVIEEHMYNNTDPCEDFWDYACGSWSEGPYYDHQDTIGAMTNFYADQLIDLVEALEISKEEFPDVSRMITKIWQYYESCRGSGDYFLKMSKYLKELRMEKILGDEWREFFSSGNEVMETDFEWLKSLAYLRTLGLNGLFFKESANFAATNSSHQVVELKIPKAERQFSNKYQIYELFEEFEFNTIFSKQKLWKLTEAVYGLQRELVQLYRNYEGFTDEMQSMTLQQLKKMERSLNWQLYFEKLVGRPLEPKSLFLEVPENLEYFQDLQNLLKQQDPHTIGWYILANFLQHLNQIKPLINSRNCLLHTNVMFPLGVNYLYTHFLYKNRQKDEKVLSGILKQLKQQFSLYLQENKFQLSAEEIKYLQRKLSAIQLKIGNLPSIIPDLNDYYSDLDLSERNFYANHLQLLQFRFQQQHKAVFQTGISTLEPDTYYVYDDIATLRNAPYFNHPRNELLIPMVFLQLPFYHHRQHPLLQYSITGWIMAHELSHAFDPLGLQFDHNGHRNPLGQEIALNPSFIDSLDCLTESSDTISLNERMADVNGLQLIWDIYSPKIGNKETGTKKFSQQQLFFINFAQFFCGSLPPTHAHDMDNVR
ncbi:endothelin-converting enzyme homolog, partial [Musca vetustissima]|uniref:endothelin-converting enzyme homolog n=1 Tax=Musca vetustissima TaxID=27455 RepID=UPI002AB60C6F